AATPPRTNPFFITPMGLLPVRCLSAQMLRNAAGSSRLAGRRRGRNYTGVSILRATDRPGLEHGGLGLHLGDFLYQLLRAVAGAQLLDLSDRAEGRAQQNREQDADQGREEQ